MDNIVVEFEEICNHLNMIFFILLIVEGQRLPKFFNQQMEFVHKLEVCNNKFFINSNLKWSTSTLKGVFDLN